MSSLEFHMAHCRHHGKAADYRIAFGTHPVPEFMQLAGKTMDEYPNSMCFASKLIFRRVNFLTACCIIRCLWKSRHVYICRASRGCCCRWTSAEIAGGVS